MIPGNNDENNNGKNEQAKQSTAPDENVIAAHEQAEADIETDPDLNSEEDPTDDLDEGELARLDNDTPNP